MLAHIVYVAPDRVLANRIVATVEQHKIEDPVYMMIDPAEYIDLPLTDNTTDEDKSEGLYLTFGEKIKGDLVSGDGWIVTNRDYAGLLLLKYSGKILVKLNHLQMKRVIDSAKTVIGPKTSVVTLNKYIRFCHSRQLLKKVMNYVKT